MAGVRLPVPADDYDASATAWAAGPERVYRRLAQALVAACAPLAGARVLDVGAGTGTVSRAARDAGAVVTATDMAPGMLAQDRHARPPAAASDARRLAFRAGAFDVVLLGFVVNHLLDPARALAEAARVARPGGLVAATVFHAEWDHPAKQAVDEVAAGFGHRPPAWYHRIKASAAVLTGYPAAFADLARAAGLKAVAVEDRVVDTGIEDPVELVAWRLGMAHLAPFVAALTPTLRRRLIDAALDAVRSHAEPVRPRVLVLTGHPGPW